jgi:hypothetical protein
MNEIKTNEFELRVIIATDISIWLRTLIKDQYLAQEIGSIECHWRRQRPHANLTTDHLQPNGVEL